MKYTITKNIKILRMIRRDGADEHTILKSYRNRSRKKGTQYS